MRPRPPKRLVPPMTAAAIASRRRMLPPVFAGVAERLDGLTTPASPARGPLRPSTAPRIAATGQPAPRPGSRVPRRSDQGKLNARPGEEAAQSDDERRHTDKDGDRPLQ